MKRSFLVLLIVAVSLSLNSCLFFWPSEKGNGNVVEENREVNDFVEIHASKGVNVYISQGDVEKVAVRADENLINVISTKVDGSVLKITNTKRIKEATENKVYVTVDKLEGITSFAGSNVYSENSIYTGGLELSCSAGSNLKLELFSGSVKLKATAGSNIFLEGNASDLEISATAGSNVKAENLNVKKCQAKAVSGANVFITVENELEAKAGTGGNVIYGGNPEILDVSSTSGGNVKKR